MSSNPKLDRVRPKPSSSTTTALMLTYRPIIFLLFAGPTLVMSLPLVAVAFRSVFGTTTDQHALLTICMTAFFSKILENSIMKAAPTKEIAIKSLERSRGWLFFATFLTSVFVIRLVVNPLEKILGLKSILTWSPSISILSALRLACGGFLLGLSVVARYIGPQSIVRCSSSPLLVNPYTRTIRSVFQSTRSSLSAPKKLCQPDDTREAQLSERQDLNPRRLQLPTSASLSAQIAISILIGITLSFTSVLPFAQDAALGNICSSTKMAIIFSCITSSALQLLLTTIYRTNHEINPTQYQSHSIRNQDIFIESLISAVQIGFAVPILAICVHLLSGSFQWSDNLVYFICVPPAIIMYLYFFDYALRILICTTPSNMKNFVEEASGGDVSMEIFVDVILRSLLHSNDELVKRLGNIPTCSSIWMDVEGEELKLNNVAIKTMADTLLHKTNEDEVSPHLEDDILRLAILSCIGGSASKEEDAIGNFKEGNKKYLMQSLLNETKCGSDSIHPYAVPIVRALCAYAGGLGEALRLIADSEDRMFYDAWVLPPGALLTGEYAIRGATHWILEGINFPRKNTGLAILISVLLNTAYKLENGLIRYQQATGGSLASDERYKEKLSNTMSPQLAPLSNVCNNCAKIILCAAKANEGFRRLDFLESFDIDCQKWLRPKMSALHQAR